MNGYCNFHSVFADELPSVKKIKLEGNILFNMCIRKFTCFGDLHDIFIFM